MFINASGIIFDRTSESTLEHSPGTFLELILIAPKCPRNSIGPFLQLKLSILNSIYHIWIQINQQSFSYVKTYDIIRKK